MWAVWGKLKVKKCYCKCYEDVGGVKLCIGGNFGS